MMIRGQSPAGSHYSALVSPSGWPYLLQDVGHEGRALKATGERWFLGHTVSPAMTEEGEEESTPGLWLRWEPEP